MSGDAAVFSGTSGGLWPWSVEQCAHEAGAGIGGRVACSLSVALEVAAHAVSRVRDVVAAGEGLPEVHYYRPEDVPGLREEVGFSKYLEENNNRYRGDKKNTFSFNEEETGSSAGQLTGLKKEPSLWRDAL